VSNENYRNSSNSDEEISLIDLFAILWRRKIMIISITLIAAVGVVVFSVISIVLPPEISPLPNEYTSEVLMLIDNKSSGGGLSSRMSGMASLAGFSMQVSSSFSNLVVFLIETNLILDTIVDEFNLIERYKIEKHPRAASRRALKKLLLASYSEKSGVLTISFTDIDPVFARDVVSFCTDFLLNYFDKLGLDKNKIEKENLELNITNTFDEIIKLEEEMHKLEQSVANASFYGRVPVITMDLNRISTELSAKRQVYTQLKVQLELLKVEMSSETPLFQILEMPEVPDLKSGPSRAILCIIVTFIAGFFSVFLAFLQNYISKIRKDPEAMAKLRGSNDK